MEWCVHVCLCVRVHVWKAWGESVFVCVCVCEGVCVWTHVRKFPMVSMVQGN